MAMIRRKHVGMSVFNVEYPEAGIRWTVLAHGEGAALKKVANEEYPKFRCGKVRVYRNEHNDIEASTSLSKGPFRFNLFANEARVIS